MKKLRLVTKLSKIESSLTLGETESRVYRASGGEVSFCLAWDTMESLLVVKAATPHGKIETLLVMECYGSDVDALIEKLNASRYFGKALVEQYLELYI